jgi:hypothetical protein
MRCYKKYAMLILFIGTILGLISFGETGGAGVSFSDSRENLSLLIDKGLVSADIREAPLYRVMSELASLTGVYVYTNPQLREKKVSVIFDNLNLESAIRRLLKGTNYALLYDRKVDKADRYVDGNSISIYIVGSDSNLVFAKSVSNYEEEDMTFPGKVAKPSEDFEKADNEVEISVSKLDHDVLIMGEPGDKIAGLQAQVSEHGEDSLPLILASMMDPDNEVREASVNLLLTELKEVVPNDALSELVLRSENPETRIDALRLLANREDENGVAQGTFELASMDSDPNVQQEARQMLTDLQAKKAAEKKDSTGDLPPTNGNGKAMIKE